MTLFELTTVLPADDPILSNCTQTVVYRRGTTTDPNTYRFEDETIEPNARYRYRLKQVDFDGTTSFSEIVEVFTEDPSQIAMSEFYPNPAGNGRATLNINVADPVESMEARRCGRTSASAGFPR